MKRGHSHCTPTDIAVALTEAQKLCGKRSGQLTPLRQKILAILLSSDQPTKAYSLLRKIRDQGITKPPTVYRAMDFLVEMGLVHKVESMTAFVPCRHWSHEHAPVLLICDECARFSELAAPPNGEPFRELVEEQGFKIRNAIMELRGICGKCVKGAAVTSD